MKENSFILDKYSIPQNNPLFVGMQVFKNIDKEIDVDTLIKRTQKERKTINNVVDEARIINAIAMLHCLGKIKYYKGFVDKCY